MIVESRKVWKSERGMTNIIIECITAYHMSEMHTPKSEYNINH